MTLISREERTRWVGASEVAALFGCHPQLTLYKLWHIKAGSIQADDLDDVERVQAGQFFEPSIAAWAAHKWEWDLIKVTQYSQHPTVAGMGSSKDYATPGPAGLEPVEIKNVDRSEFHKPEKGWATESQELVDAPVYFLIQVQHQLACWPGIPQGWIVPCVGGNRIYRMPIERHDGMIRKIEERVAWFWDTIKAGKEPPPNFEKDNETITKLYRGLGLEAIDLTKSNRARSLCDLYKLNLQQESVAKKAKDACMAELKFLMNDARAADIDGYRIKASRVEGGTTIRQPYWRFNITQSKE